MRIAEVESLPGLGDDDRVAPVGREVEVVGIGRPGSASARAARPRVDRREAVAEVVVDVQGAQVVRRRDVLRQRADAEVVDDLERALIDDVDGVRLAVRDVDERARVRAAPVRAPGRSAAYTFSGAAAVGPDLVRACGMRALMRSVTPCAVMPPAITICFRSVTAARSLRASFRWPAAETCPVAGRIAITAALIDPRTLPWPPMMKAVSPSVAAAACVVAAAREAIRRVVWRRVSKR